MTSTDRILKSISRVIAAPCFVSASQRVWTSIPWLLTHPPRDGANFRHATAISGGGAHG